MKSDVIIIRNLIYYKLSYVVSSFFRHIIRIKNILCNICCYASCIFLDYPSAGYVRWTCFLYVCSMMEICSCFLYGCSDGYASCHFLMHTFRHKHGSICARLFQLLMSHCDELNNPRRSSSTNLVLLGS